MSCFGPSSREVFRAVFGFVVDRWLVLEDAELGAGDVEDWCLGMRRRRWGKVDILSHFDILKMKLLF